MATYLKCPNCNKKIEISTALRGEIEDEIRQSVRESIKKEVGEEKELELKDLKNQLNEKNKKVEDYQEKELKLREEKRKLEESKKEFEIRLQRQLDSQRSKIEQETLEKASEEYRLKDKEKDKVIEDLKKSLDEARRKALQGSQQLQGEILELDIEKSLKNAFPNDEINPVEKGVKGADISQLVKSPKGYPCGVILWETKRTKSWSDGWIKKLKKDLRAQKANIPIIASQALPDEAKGGFGIKDGVWIVSFNLIIPIATLIRKNLLDVGFQKAVSEHKGGKKEVLYDYITSHEFIQQVESLVEVYKDMHTQIDKERMSFERQWKEREGQLQRLIGSTVSVVGSIQGRVGSSSLQIKGLDLLELEGGD